MNELTHALAIVLTTDPLLSLIILVCLIGGAGNRLAYVLSGRTTNARLKAQLDAANAEIARQHQAATQQQPPSVEGELPPWKPTRSN